MFSEKSGYAKRRLAAQWSGKQSYLKRPIYKIFHQLKLLCCASFVIVSGNFSRSKIGPLKQNNGKYSEFDKGRNE